MFNSTRFCPWAPAEIFVEEHAQKGPIKTKKAHHIEKKAPHKEIIIAKRLSYPHVPEGGERLLLPFSLQALMLLSKATFYACRNKSKKKGNDCVVYKEFDKETNPNPNFNNRLDLIVIVRSVTRIYRVLWTSVRVQLVLFEKLPVRFCPRSSELLTITAA